MAHVTDTFGPKRFNEELEYLEWVALVRRHLDDALISRYAALSAQLFREKLAPRWAAWAIGRAAFDDSSAVAEDYEI